MPVDSFLLPQVTVDSVVEVPLRRADVYVVALSESVLAEGTDFDCSCIFELYEQDVGTTHFLMLSVGS